MQGVCTKCIPICLHLREYLLLRCASKSKTTCAALFTLFISFFFCSVLLSFFLTLVLLHGKVAFSILALVCAHQRAWVYLGEYSVIIMHAMASNSNIFHCKLQLRCDTPIGCYIVVNSTGFIIIFHLVHNSFSLFSSKKQEEAYTHTRILHIKPAATILFKPIVCNVYPKCDITIYTVYTHILCVVWHFFSPWLIKWRVLVHIYVYRRFIWIYWHNNCISNA